MLEAVIPSFVRQIFFGIIAENVHLVHEALEFDVFDALTRDQLRNFACEKLLDELAILFLLVAYELELFFSLLIGFSTLPYIFLALLFAPFVGIAHVMEKFVDFR